jgi:hypothetical protein
MRTQKVTAICFNQVLGCTASIMPQQVPIIMNNNYKWSRLDQLAPNYPSTRQYQTRIATFISSVMRTGARTRTWLLTYFASLSHLMRPSYWDFFLYSVDSSQGRNITKYRSGKKPPVYTTERVNGCRQASNNRTRQCMSKTKLNDKGTSKNMSQWLTL